MEITLKNREQELKEVVNGHPIPQFIINNKHIVTYWNRALENLTSVKAEDVVGTTAHWKAFHIGCERPCLVDLLVDDDKEGISKWYEGTISVSSMIFNAYESTAYLPKLGKWLFALAKKIKDPEGNIIGAIETIIDVTEIRKNEESLKNSNKQLEEILDFLPDATMIVNAEGNVIAWNKAIETMSGVPRQEMIGKDHYNVATPFYGYPRPFLIDMLAKDTEDSNKYDFIERAQNTIFGEIYAPAMNNYRGGYIWAIASNLRDSKGNIIGSIESVRDISRYKQTEKALRVSEEKYKDLYDNNPSMYFTVNAEGIILSVNSFGCDQLGFSADELKGQTIKCIYPDEDKDKAIYNINLCIASVGHVYNWELRKVRKNKSILWVKQTARALLNPEGEIVVFIVCEDITGKKQTEEVFLESERKYRQLVNNSFAGIYIVQDDVIKYCNRMIVDYFGFSKDEEIIGRHYKEFVSTENRNLKLEESRRELLNSKEAGSYEFVAIRKDGTTFEAEVLESRINYEGKPAIQGTLLNISERKKVERDIKKLSRAVEQNPSIILITNLDGEIEYVNPSFEKVTGYSSEEVIGKTPRFLKSGFTSKEVYENLWKTIISGNEWRGEIQNKKKNGKLYWETVTISSIRDEKGNITHFVAVKEDITEKKELEFELKHAVDRAEESNRLKSSLLANMSHELRTPLNGILGLSQLLKDELANESLFSYANKIYISGKRLMITLNSILDLSEIESNTTQINIQPYNIAEEIGFLLTQYNYSAKEKGLYFNIEIKDRSCLAKVDERLCNQILINLIDNAVKYTNKGGIDVVVESDYEEISPRLKISISDTGIGIMEKDIPLIFEEFRQVSEGYSRSFEGSGLGLTLVNKMLALLNGEIKVESQIGIGSKFIVYLPATVRESSEEPEIQPEEIETIFDENPHFSILLVEDNLINKEVISCYIENLYDVDSVDNGMDAVQMASQKVYDLILMDINLGSDMDGIAATREIKKFPGYEDIPVVAMTGYAMSGDKERLLKEGLTHYLAKPFEKEELLRLIGNIFTNQ